MMKKKNNVFLLSATILFLLIASTILGLCRLLWWYYPLGVILGVLTHLLMLIQNKRFFRIQENEVEKALFHPKKDAFLWYGLRILVIIVGFAGIVLLASFIHRDRLLEVSLITLGGIVTVKVLFIASLLIFKEGR